MKSWTRRALEAAAGALPLGAWFAGLGLPVCSPFYHVVSDEPLPHIRHLYAYRGVAGFERDLDHFGRRFEFVGLEQVRALLLEGRRLPRRAMLLTFDDGLREMFEVVRPILLRRGIPAVFFVNGAFVDNRDLFFRNKASLLVEELESRPGPRWAEALAQVWDAGQGPMPDARGWLLSRWYVQRHELDALAAAVGYDFGEFLRERRPYMETGELRTLQAEGFALGSHSIDHPRLGELALDEQVRQALEPVRALAAQGLRLESFAFPFNDQDVGAAFFERMDAAGICPTFGTDGFWRDQAPRNLHRFWMENSGLEAPAILARYLLWASRRQSRGKNLLSRA